MRFVYLVVFTVVSIFLGATGHIVVRDRAQEVKEEE